MIPADVLDRRVVRRAVEAWLNAYRHVTFVSGDVREGQIPAQGDGEWDPFGPFTGETADQVIERKVRFQDNPALWRAYETEVCRLASIELFGEAHLMDKRSRHGQQRIPTTKRERARIVKLLREGRTLADVARIVGRSIALVHNIRKESAA